MSSFPTGDHAQASAAQIYTWAVQAGFSPAEAVIATAITFPESGGYPGIVQSGQPYSKTGWGLWQITPGNSVPSVGVDNALLDGATNARAAYAKYHAAGNSFQPWTTYDDGKYKSFLSQAQAGASGAGNVTAGIGGPVTGGAANGIGGPVNGSGLASWTKLYGSASVSPQGVITGGPGDIQTIVGGNLPSWMQGLWDSLGSISQTFLDSWSWLSGPVNDLDKMIQGVLWLVNPANWVRLIAGFIGAILVIIGGVLIAKAS